MKQELFINVINNVSVSTALWVSVSVLFGTYELSSFINKILVFIFNRLYVNYFKKLTDDKIIFERIDDIEFQKMLRYFKEHDIRVLDISSEASDYLFNLHEKLKDIHNSFIRKSLEEKKHIILTNLTEFINCISFTLVNGHLTKDYNGHGILNSEEYQQKLDKYNEEATDYMRKKKNFTDACDEFVDYCKKYFKN